MRNITPQLFQAQHYCSFPWSVIGRYDLSTYLALLLTQMTTLSTGFEATLTFKVAELWPKNRVIAEATFLRRKGSKIESYPRDFLVLVMIFLNLTLFQSACLLNYRGFVLFLSSLIEYNLNVVNLSPMQSHILKHCPRLSTAMPQISFSISFCGYLARLLRHCCVLPLFSEQVFGDKWWYLSANCNLKVHPDHFV